MNGNISREVPIHYTLITDKLITDNLQTKYKKLQWKKCKQLHALQNITNYYKSMTLTANNKNKKLFLTIQISK